MVLFENSIANGKVKIVTLVMIMVMTYFYRALVVRKDPRACFRLGVCMCASV